MHLTKSHVKTRKGSFSTPRGGGGKKNLSFCKSSSPWKISYCSVYSPIVWADNALIFRLMRRGGTRLVKRGVFHENKRNNWKVSENPSHLCSFEYIYFFSRILCIFGMFKVLQNSRKLVIGKAYSRPDVACPEYISRLSGDATCDSRYYTRQPG